MKNGWIMCFVVKSNWITLGSKNRPNRTMASLSLSPCVCLSPSLSFMARDNGSDIFFLVSKYQFYTSALYCIKILIYFFSYFDTVHVTLLSNSKSNFSSLIFFVQEKPSHLTCHLFFAWSFSMMQHAWDVAQKWKTTKTAKICDNTKLMLPGCASNRRHDWSVFF